MSRKNLKFGKKFTDIDFDAQDFIDAIGTLTTPQEDAIKDLVTGLKANGTWDKYHAIYPMIGGTADSHKWNLKNPLDTDSAYRLTFYGTWTHDSNGAKGDGSTAWAQTWFYASAHTFVSGTVDAFYSYYSNLNVAGSSQQDTELGSGVNSSNTFALQIHETTQDKTFGSIYDSAWREYVHTSGYTGYFGVNSLGGTAKNFINGSFLTGSERTQTNSSAGNNPLGLNTICTSSNGLSDNSAYRSTRRTAFVCIGNGFTDTEIADDYTTIQAYQTALSRQV